MVHLTTKETLPVQQSKVCSQNFEHKDDYMQTIQPAEKKALDQIAKFRARTGMAKTMFGKNAVGDANLIGQLEGGRQLRHEMREKIKAFIAAYKVKK
jgi:hypothetical protein